MLALDDELSTPRGLMVSSGTGVDATSIAAPSATRHQTRRRDPQMHQTKKGNPWHFGGTAHVGTDAARGLTPSVVVTPAHVHDVTQAHALLHGEERDVFADAGDQGVDQREKVQNHHPEVIGHVARRPGKRKQLDTSRPLDALIKQIETVKARIRARGEHVFGVVPCVFRYTKVREAGLKKNAAPLITLLMLANLWLVRRQLMPPSMGYGRPRGVQEAPRGAAKRPGGGRSSSQRPPKRCLN